MKCCFCTVDKPLRLWEPTRQACVSSSCSEDQARVCPVCHKIVTHTWLDMQDEWKKSVFYRSGKDVYKDRDLWISVILENEKWERQVDFDLRQLREAEGSSDSNKMSDGAFKLYQLSSRIHKRIEHLKQAMQEGNEYKDNYW